MEEKAGNPQLVWGMFGGNNAYFGAIARACIYQPLDPGHPFGWGKAWDEDEDGTGVCKQNLQMAKEYLDKPSSMRKAFTNALDDILNVAQGNRALDYSFDLYVSSYVRFFDDTTDDCDEWTFAHNRLSVGRPKLVKGLRKTINEKILQLNNIQADVIQNYKPPATDPKLVNVNIKNFQPDYLFDGHRFCEKGRSLEDQYYHKDLWLWNLQYNDDKTGEEGGAVTGNDGVKQMASTSSAGVNVTEGFQTVLGADTNPDAIIPPDQDAHTQQYGFGWTARPFHPKFDGHTALKDAFIKKMQDDRVPGIVLPDVAPPPEVPELVAPTPPPPPNIDKKCWGVGTGKFLSREMLATLIETEFCPTAVKQGVLDVGAGSLSRRYNEGSMEDVTIAIEWVPGLPFQPNMKDCVDRLLGDLTDGCDGNDPNNIDNSKAGGLVKVGEVTYRIDPQTSRQSATLTRWAGCDSIHIKVSTPRRFDYIVATISAERLIDCLIKW
ncbi:hypothetical protein M7I_1075 [Glarea lozoyensis 74030]|uniref:Uncharacterized protein n=1 Tax=Glarea lozoyensis (strain ATCC 74030 / MF5533) TaxID=1104152 RepID=H0EF37_GLAL7|nr:hypothetical protein M7I_1075 [Glarea lozoyensis 74030]